MTRLHLDQTHVAGGAEHGGFLFRLWNAGDEAVAVARLCYASMTRPARDARASPGRVARVFANHVELVFEPAETVAPGAALEVRLAGLSHAPTNRSQGAMAAWVVTPEGATVEAAVGDLHPPEGRARGPVKDWPAGRPGPLGLLPWPASVEVGDLGDAPVLVPAGAADRAAFAAVAALHRRLFPSAPAPLALGPVAGALPVEAARGDHPPGGYALRLGEVVRLEHADADGLRHGLITLAQMAHAARAGPHRFPRSGAITDAPRHGWRGLHLDVARNFRTAEEVTRLVDVMAWQKMNRLHWHLADDEGYRLPSRAFPALNDVGARRGAGAPLPPQYADGPGGQAGFYAEAEVARIVAHAAALGVEVVPEIDVPGHATAILTAIPDLRDPDEPEDSYRPVQGYPNNALNPALERTYEVVGALLDEVCALFPGPVIHVGGDEVAPDSWHASPRARELASRLGVEGAMALQSHFLRRVQGMVHERGRVMGGWDECALGGGIGPERTVLMAWQGPELAGRLMAEGYDVVATPGQAYYLDMAQGAGWDAHGTSWAGPVPPETTYRFEAALGLPEGPGRLLGVQAGLWAEHLRDMDRLRDMLHPRLSAVAEAGWTPAAGKDWERFAALSRGMPLP